MSKKQNIRIVDIARLAKVSVGTVDRVLHKRGRVSEEKRKQVEKVLEEINYEPNMVARFLASKRTFVFAVIIPSFQAGDYWELVSSGIEKAANELKDFNVTIDYLFFDQFDSTSFVEETMRLKKADYAGVIIPTLHKEKVVELSKKLDKEEIPYVFIDSNIEGCNNLSYFGSNSSVSGAVAARLILTEIGDRGNIIITHAEYKEQEASTQIESREAGFLAHLKEHNYQGNITYLNFNPHKKEEGSKKLESFLSLNHPTGIVIFNSRIYELVYAVEKLRSKSEQISLIGYDSIERNVAALKKDQISYLISQRSIQQGYESIKSLSNFLIFNNLSAKENYMGIDILIKENIDFYND